MGIVLKGPWDKRGTVWPFHLKSGVFQCKSTMLHNALCKTGWLLHNHLRLHSSVKQAVHFSRNCCEEPASKWQAVRHVSKLRHATKLTYVSKQAHMLLTLSLSSTSHMSLT